MKLTKAQIKLLRRVEDGDEASLMNDDEHEPQWWIDGDRAAPKRTAEALVDKGMVEFCARWGGHPGILGFRLSAAGRAALKEMEKTDAR